MTLRDVPVPSSSADFRRIAPMLSSARAEIEQTALAGICHMLSDALRSYPSITHCQFSFEMGLRSFVFYENGKTPPFVHANIEIIAEQIHHFMSHFANDQFYALCQRDAKLVGPSAVEFAHQMQRPDVATLIEQSALREECQQGNPARTSRL